MSQWPTPGAIIGPHSRACFSNLMYTCLALILFVFRMHCQSVSLQRVPPLIFSSWWLSTYSTSSNSGYGRWSSYIWCGFYMLQEGPLCRNSTGGNSVLWLPPQTLKQLSRYRKVPTFRQGTIRRFHKNASAMKRLAARDFKDLLQVSCSLSSRWYHTGW